MTGKLSRRGFLKSAAVAAVGLIGTKSIVAGGNKEVDETDWKARYKGDYRKWQESCDAHHEIIDDLDAYAKRLEHTIEEQEFILDLYAQEGYELSIAIMDKDELITKQHEEIVSLECALYDGQVVTSIDDSPSEFDMPYLPCDKTRLPAPRGACPFCGGVDWKYDAAGYIICAHCKAIAEYIDYLVECDMSWVPAKIEDVVMMHPDDFVHLKQLWPTYVKETGNDSA